MALTPVNPALGRLGQGDCCVLEIGLDYRVRPCLRKKKKKEERVSEMAEWVRTLAVKPDHLGLVPGTHLVERENQLSQIPSPQPPLTSCGMRVHTHKRAHTYIR